MVNYLKRTWANVDLDALAYNLQSIRARLQPGCRILGVVKADAYGHGDRYVALEMERLGVDWFGVSGINEALSLRSSGVRGDILIFGFTPPEYASELARHNITQTVFSPEYAAALSEAACGAGVTLRVHIKVDTGMSRIGFSAADHVASVQQIMAACALPNLCAEGIFTHLACADEDGEDARRYTLEQFNSFETVCHMLAERGVTFAIRHCCNSAGVINYPEMHLDMVRPGIISYGLLPSKECEGKIDLRPMMELRTTVTMVKAVRKGESVSYGRIYTADSDRVVATVAIGYADGYHRLLSNKGCMIVRGRYAPVIGRVCMDQLMLDVTGIPGVCAGDEAIIVGSEGEASLTFTALADASLTVNYEIPCLIGKRVPRVYFRGGEEIGVMDLIPATVPDRI